MSHVAGVDREQSALLPLSLCDLVTASNPCRVIEAFVDTLCLSGLGLSKAKATGVGRPPYDPADMLKRYLYGYLNQVRSSRRLERQEAWIEQRMAKYLAQLDAADTAEQDTELDREKVQEAVEKPRKKQAQTKALAAELKAQGNTHMVLGEPQARLMRKVGPGHNLQSAVDEHSAMIVAHELNNEATDNRMLRSMAQAAKAILNVETLDVLADADCSNGAQGAELEAQQIRVHAPANRNTNSSGDGTLLDKSKFVYSA